MRASRSSRKRAARARVAPRSRLVPAMSWKSLSTSRSRADRQEALLLDRAQQHRLLVEAELADLVEEQHAAVGRRAAGPARSATAPVNAPFTWPNSARHRAVAAQRGAVDLDERARDLAARLASARRCAARAATCRRRSARSAASARASAIATCSMRSISAVEGRVARRDAGLEELTALALLLRESATRCGRTARDRDR